jgi:hypothetical protein
MCSWPFFLHFHTLYAMCPNVNPIVVTTGVGPSGPSMQWIQQPDYFIDLILLADNPSQAHVPPAFAERDSPAPLTPPRPFRTDSTNHYKAGTPSIPVATPTPAFTASHAPMPSTASRQAVEKMKANIWVASKK